MGHELLKTTGSRSLKRARKREILSAIVNIRAQAAEMQKENFAALCGQYGREHVVRVCCDLVVLTDGREIPLSIWDYASGMCSHTPRVDAALMTHITQKQMTTLFRNCIVREEWVNGRVIVHRKI